MDEFAQTRGSDGLFDDDFTPIPAPTSESSNPVPIEEAPPPPLQSPTHEAAPLTRPPQPVHPAPKQIPDPSTSSPNPSASSNTPTPTTTTTTTTSSTTQPPLAQPRAHTPVRGDRHLTGGVAKPKLTEEELSAKLAAAKLNSAKRAEAHRLAEADEADFKAREAKVQVRRQEEGKARRVMDMERERNRMRKLGSKGGREWDEGKEEVQHQQDRGRGYRRGVNGSIVGGRGGGGISGLYQDGLPDREQEEHRGGHEFHRRGRGRGRGGRGSFHVPVARKEEQKIPDPEQDFPALPQKPKATPSKPPNTSMQSPQPASEPSWADQVNSEAQKAGDDRKS